MVKRSYQQYCPAARTLDLVGERWTLLIVRNLMAGPQRYSDLRAGLPGMASNLLAERLSELQAAGFVTKEHRTEPRAHDVYVLTQRGDELRAVLYALARFGLPLLGSPTAADQPDPEQTALAIVAMLHPGELPDRAMSVRFSLDECDTAVTIADRGRPGARPSFAERVAIVSTESAPPADVTVRGSLPALMWVRQGALEGEDALDQGLVAFDGPDEAVATVQRMLGFGRVSPPARPG